MCELCLFYMTVHKMSRDARSCRDHIMYLVEMCIIMILLYYDIMTCTSRRDLMIVSSRSYDIMISLYDCVISSRYNRAVSSRSWELTNGGVCGKMPRPYIFMAGVLTFFRGCAIIRSLRSQGSGTIIRNYKRYKRDYKRDINSTILSYNTTVIQYYKRNKTHIYVF
jgi:hypothetical protein